MSLVALTYQDYIILCKKLGFYPKHKLYSSVCEYMIDYAKNEGFNSSRFSVYLENIEISKWNAILFDVSTKIFINNHKYRFVLNAIVAVHECDSSSFNSVISRASQRYWGVRFFYLMSKVPFLITLSLFWYLYHLIVFNFSGFISYLVLCSTYHKHHATQKPPGSPIFFILSLSYTSRL